MCPLRYVSWRPVLSECSESEKDAGDEDEDEDESLCAELDDDVTRRS